MSWNPEWERDPRYTGSAETPSQAAPAAAPGGPISSSPGSVQQPTASSAPGQPAAVESAAQYAPPAVPLVDIVDSPEELTVYVDTPGFEEEHLEIHADGNTLHLSGDRHEEPPGDVSSEQRLLTERPLRVERTIALPLQIDPEQVVATHENGVCHITIPKEEQNQRHEIGFQ
ncbi:MAG: Hsp20/alpha crystallin family protein [Halanaeroarchaeum sp.]